MDDHVHDHGHDHGHHERPASQSELRARALEALLVERGLVSTDAIDAVVSYYENDVGPQNGARVIARAWVDPEYRARLLRDGSAAIGELGFAGVEGEHMVVVENTPDVHNVIVCTLCSCYPWPVLGLPPAWYKSPAYRARVVAEPRRVLAEFGLQLDVDVELRVWDSTAEVRYLVLPERPAGAEDLSEEQLAALVTRDAMIGVARVEAPAGAAAGAPARRSPRSMPSSAATRRCRATTASSCSTRSGTAARSAWESSCWSAWACRGARSGIISRRRSSVTGSPGESPPPRPTTSRSWTRSSRWWRRRPSFRAVSMRRCSASCSHCRPR
jgi:nitrile hydratase